MDEEATGPDGQGEEVWRVEEKGKKSWRGKSGGDFFFKKVKKNQEEEERESEIIVEKKDREEDKLVRRKPIHLHL